MSDNHIKRIIERILSDEKDIKITIEIKSKQKNTENKKVRAITKRTTK